MDKLEEALRRKLEEKFDKSWIDDHVMILGPTTETEEDTEDAD